MPLSQSDTNRHPIDLISEGIKKDLSRLYNCPIFTAFPIGEEEMKVPSIIIECVRLDPRAPVGNGEALQKTYWEIRAILPAFSDGKSLQLEAAIMASEIAERVGNDRYYAKGSEEMKFEDASPDNLTRRATNIEAWTISFSCNIRVGRDDYELTGAYPSASPEQRQSYLSGRVFQP